MSYNPFREADWNAMENEIADLKAQLTEMKDENIKVKAHNQRLKKMLEDARESQAEKKSSKPTSCRRYDAPHW